MTAGRIFTVPGASPWVEVGVGDSRIAGSVSQWDSARWDNAGAKWAGDEPSWLDVSCHVIGCDDRRGRNRTTEHWEVGTATFAIANGDGWADLLAGAKPPGVLDVRPGRSIRWGVQLDGGPRLVLWRGVIDAQTALYDGRLAAADTVTIDAVDTLGDAGRTVLVAVDPPVGAGETASARIGRVLDAVTFPASRRSIDVDYVPLVATDLAGPVVDLLTVTADSTGGSVFGDVAGRIVYRRRDWQLYMPGAPVDATIGNTAGAVCPTSYDVSFARAEMTTRAIVGPADGTPVVVDDAAAQRVYGIETSPTRDDLVTTDTVTLTAIANRLVAAHGAATMPRIAAVTVDAATSTAARDFCATVDPARPSRYRCVLVRDGRTVFDRTMLAVAAEHSWDAHGWRCRVTLDDAAPYAIAGGRWDTARWDQASWTNAAALRDEAAALLQELTP
jgi:hypothetical protein